jgi:hypothetical protein
MGGIFSEKNAYVDNDHEWTTNNALLFKIAYKPYNHNWDNLLLIGLYFTAGSNQTSSFDIKIDKYILLLLFFFFFNH